MRYAFFDKEGSQRVVGIEDLRHGILSGDIDIYAPVLKEGDTEPVAVVTLDEVFSGPVDADLLDLIPVDNERPLKRNAYTVDVKQEPKYAEPVSPSSEVEKPPKIKHQRKKSAEGKKTKRFFLIDPKQGRLGPLTPREISSLYNRGVVKDRVRVVKQGTNRKIPVRHFLAVYQRTLKSAKGETGVGNRGAVPSTKVLNEMANIETLKKNLKLNWPVTGAVIAFLLAGPIVLGLRQFSGGSSPEPFAPDYFEGGQTSSAPAINAAPEVVKNLPTEPIRRPLEITPSPPKQKVIQEKRPSRVVKPRPQRVVRRNKVAAKPKRPPPPPVVNRRPIQRPIARAVRPAPRALPKPSSPVRLASSRVGKRVSLPSMRFSSAILKQCGLKCSMTFRDSSGNGIKVVFFTAAFQSKLARRRGNATITGLVSREGGGIQLLLQAVN